MLRRIIFLSILLLPMGPVFAQKAPDFTLSDTEGKRFKLSEALRNGPVLVDFWATWCKPCVQELPHIDALNEIYREQGLQIVAISIDSPKSQSKVKPFIKGSGFEFRVLFDPDMEVRKLFGGKDIPLTLLIDKNGQIVFQHLGFNPGDEKSLGEKVASLFPSKTKSSGNDSGKSNE